MHSNFIINFRLSKPVATAIIPDALSVLGFHTKKLSSMELANLQILLLFEISN